MANIVIVGGKLQGGEAAYLGREAEIDVILIDSDPMAPAQKLCSRFLCGDVLGGNPEVLAALEAADMILPTMENYEVLCGLEKLCEKKGYRLAFDMDAYEITSSKRSSDELFASNNLPCPEYWPNGNLPYRAKPDLDSGSHSIKAFGTGNKDSQEEQAELEAFIRDGGAEKYVVQEFVSGPSYSVEIIGEPGNYRVYEPTQIFVDSDYDCNVAAANRVITKKKRILLEGYAVRIAELLRLKGIMDLEVIDTDEAPDGAPGAGKGIKILEIDARLPSQTSVAVYHATGMNYIKELYDLFVNGKFIDSKTDRGLCATYTQYLVRRNSVAECLGEHILVEGGLLEFDCELCISKPGEYCGSRAVTDRIWSRENGAEEWRGFFVNWAEDMEMLDKEVKKWNLIL